MLSTNNATLSFGGRSRLNAVAGTNGDDLEADRGQLGAVEHETAVKDECGAGAVVVDLLPVEGLELVPLGADDDRLGTGTCLDCVVDNPDVLLDGLGRDGSVVGEVEPHLLLGDLGVVEGDAGLLGEEVVGDRDGGGLAGVTGVLLEGPSEDGDLLASDGVEEGLDDLAREAVLLVLVHLDDGTPVFGDLGEVERLGKVDKVENVLLEARATESNGCLEELGADTGVLADGVGYLVNVGTGSLADSGKSIDGRDTLGKHGVGSKLGELGRPETDSEDTVLGDPVGVDLRESLAGVEARLGLERSDKDTVGGEEVSDGGSLGKELGVGENVESASGLRVGLEDGAHRLCGTARDGGLLDDDLGGSGDLGDAAGGKLEVAEGLAACCTALLT